jgi:hypothetical protein
MKPPLVPELSIPPSFKIFRAVVLEAGLAVEVSICKVPIFPCSALGPPVFRTEPFPGPLRQVIDLLESC